MRDGGTSDLISAHNSQFYTVVKSGYPGSEAAVKKVLRGENRIIKITGEYRLRITPSCGNDGIQRATTV